MTRRLVRDWFGPVLAYRLWLIVPLAALAWMLPLPPGDFSLRSVAVAYGPPAVSFGANATAPIPTARADGPLVFFGVWLLGAIALAAAIILEHRRALRAYGALTPASLSDTPVHRTSRPGAGPSLIGVFRPCLIVPANFETSFTPQEQELVLEHERQHSFAGDPLVNGVVALFRCLNWFNPLVHYAAMQLRIDQELACDAAVIARRPEGRRTYAEALLKTQLAPIPTQMGCHWPGRSCRLLMERIEMLGHEKPRGARRVAGVASVLAIGLSAGLTALILQPAFTLHVPAYDETARLAAFAANDADGDGRIDKAGYSHVLQTFGISHDTLDSRFAQRDANKDGFVSAEEFKTPIPQ